jgi:phosphoribosylformylglycinamidine (FGAM) synthase PurS component
MKIEVWTKNRYAASEERALVSTLAGAGLRAGRVRLSRIYSVDAPWPKKDFERLAAGLLADPITEDWSLSGRPAAGADYRVEVWLKNSVTDVIGESVKEAVRDMLERSPQGVRFGRAYYVRCASAAKLGEAVRKTLANEVVSTVTVGKI